MNKSIMAWTRQKRIKKFALPHTFGYHSCPICWESYTGMPIILTQDIPEYQVKTGDDICPKCAKLQSSL